MITDVLTREFRYKKRDNVPFWPYNQKATRETLAKVMGETGFKTGAEVGVYYGGYSLTLCKNIPNLKLICVDPWKPFGTRRLTDEKMERIYKSCVQTLSPYDVKFMRMASMEAAKEISNASLDFVYIDAMHDFDNVMIDVILWSPKVRIGGVVAGHDFGQFYQGGVVDVVYAYTRAHNIWPWYMTSVNTDEGEICPSWFWVVR